MKFLKYVVLIFFLPIIIIIIHLNIALFHGATCDETSAGVVNTEVINQLNFVKKALESGAGEEMQEIYPEGFVFMYSLYGLAWADVGMTLNPNSDLQKRAIEELDWTLEKLYSENGTAPFTKNLSLEYGAFYQGWTNFVLAKKLAITPENQRDSIETILLQANCDLILLAKKQFPHPYLPSYYGQSWQADNVVCLATLALYDKIMEPRYTNEVDRWLSEIKTTLDEKTGLIGHAYDYNLGKPLPPRGSSQSLINNFLFEIDSVFAREQTAIYKDLFLTYRLGLPGIREYPKGTEDNGDIDSGPVIWGVGGSASLVGIRTMALADETAIYKGLRNSVQGFGVGFTIGKEKKFLFGQLPMADVFIAWANAKNCQVNQETTYWQWKFNLGSLLILGLIFFVIWLSWRSRKIS